MPNRTWYDWYADRFIINPGQLNPQASIFHDVTIGGDATVAGTFDVTGTTTLADVSTTGSVTANNVTTTGDITGGEFITSNAGDLDLRVNDDTGILRLGGGSSAGTGSQLYIYGGSHVTYANDLRFFGLFSLALHYDYSENLWDFQANQIVTTGEILPGGSGGPIWTTGEGTPEGAVTADVGSLFTRTDGGANTTLYVKESGTGNTGWVAK